MEAGSQERLVAISRSIEIAELTRQVFVEVVAYALRPARPVGGWRLLRGVGLQILNDET